MTSLARIAAGDIDIPQSFAYQRDDSNPQNTFIIAVDLALTPDLMPAGKNLVVWADHVTISSALSLQGQNVSIIARRLVSQNGSIDVSGLPPAQRLARATDGAAPPGTQDGLQGASGTDGARGSDGKGGGQIWITATDIEGNLTLIAHGGNGQQGQDGGNGGDGHMGTPGADGRCTGYGGPGTTIQSQAQPGNIGGAGGWGGNAGRSGNGGAAGTIKLWTIPAVASKTIPGNRRRRRQQETGARAVPPASAG
jgi:hypothetical protein